MLQKKWPFLSRKSYNKIFSALRLFLVMLFALILTALAIWIIKGDVFRIRNISCSRGDFPCGEELVFLEDLRGQHILLTDFTSVIRKTKENLPYIRDIKISRQLPDKIIITVMLREPLAALTSEQESWLLIDKDDFIYKKVFSKQINLPEIFLPPGETDLYVGQKTNSQIIQKALLLATKLKENFIFFKEIRLTQGETIIVTLSEPVIASFSSQKAVISQVDSLQFILHQSKIEGKLPVGIDLRFNKPVIRY